MVRSRGDRPQEFAGIENAIRLGQQIFRRDVESQRRQPASVQPDVATRLQELKKILNFEQIAIALQARRSHSAAGVARIDLRRPRSPSSGSAHTAPSTKSTSTSTPVRPDSRQKCAEWGVG